MKLDFIDKLIEDREFHEPTISCISKFKSTKIPVICEKCIQGPLNIDKHDDTRDTSLNSSFGYFTPSSMNRDDKRLCLIYKTKKRSQSNIEIGEVNKNRINLPKIKKQKDKNEIKKISSEAKRKQKEHETPMNEGDIRFMNTKSGIEVKRLPTKNCLITDVFKSDAFTGRTQKLYMEWLRKQQEGEVLTQTNKKKNFLLEYETQLNDVLKNVKKGALSYETWARQSYEIKILSDKIKEAKTMEDKEEAEKTIKRRKKLIESAVGHWRLKKRFSINPSTKSSDDLISLPRIRK